MIDNKKILCIIPARGGSKRLPRKNVKPLLGKPLISWTIEQAKRSKYIDRIIVSTEDEEIAKISEQHGIYIPFLRPVELAQDNTPTINVIEHVINKLEKKPDIIVLLEPTSPIRKKTDVDNMIHKLLERYDDFDSIVSIGEIHLEKPNLALKIQGEYIKKYIDDLPTNEKSFFPYGVSYISKTSTLLQQKTFLQKRTTFYILERYQCYEIDDIYDFICIESIMKYLLEKGEIL
ncbi:MAG: acylneuraminate cytidylyltransferase family protein [Candidatus Calescibacterium sp.]|nr:acylneuraminate cytidylyltransferase family protein [Candidatus Calescibacterium sp.]MDW8132998.1 acylneuraminate cytidylyltransferase family protein [Candidatus Calescibacterium sp.]